MEALRRIKLPKSVLPHRSGSAFRTQFTTSDEMERPPRRPIHKCNGFIEELEWEPLVNASQIGVAQIGVDWLPAAYSPDAAEPAGADMGTGGGTQPASMPPGFSPLWPE